MDKYMLISKELVEHSKFDTFCRCPQDLYANHEENTKPT